MFPLIKKDIKVLMASPILAVVASIFLFLTGFAFTAAMTQVIPGKLPEASVRGIIYFMAVILLFITPFLTMRSFAEEKKTGTLEFLKTSPLTPFQIVFGKFLGVLFLVLFIVALTVEFPILIFTVGTPDVGEMILSYVGLILLGLSYVALGIFCSVLTKNQMISAVLAFVISITLWFLAEVGGDVGEMLSPISHLQSFSTGVLDIGDLAYFCSFIFIFLFLSIGVLEIPDSTQKWKPALTTGMILVSLLGVYYLIQTRHWRYDATEKKEFSLSSQTLNLLQNLSQEIQITAFFGPGEDLDDVYIRRRVDDILREYKARSRGKIKYHMIDGTQDITRATQFGIHTDGTIVVQSGSNRKDIYKSQLFDFTNISENTLPLFTGEGQFTNAILKVLKNTQTTLCFLEGHGERLLEDPDPSGLSQLQKELNNNNYDTERVSFTKNKEVPTRCALLVVAGPKKPALAAEDRVIQSWVSKEGKVLVMAEALTENPLPETLQSLNIKLNNDLVFDPDRHFVVGPQYPAPVLLPHPITQDLQEMNPILFSARSLTVVQDSNQAQEILQTSPSAWGETDLKGGSKPEFNFGKDPKGPLTLAYALEKDGQPQAIVVGDVDFTTNSLIGAPGNLDLVMNMLGWLVNDKDQVTIRPRTPDYRNVTLTSGNARFISWFTQLVYPLIVLLGIGSYWYRRRNR